MLIFQGVAGSCVEKKREKAADTGDLSVHVRLVMQSKKTMQMAINV